MFSGLVVAVQPFAQRLRARTQKVAIQHLREIVLPDDDVAPALAKVQPIGSPDDASGRGILDRAPLDVGPTGSVLDPEVADQMDGVVIWVSNCT